MAKYYGMCSHVMIMYRAPSLCQEYAESSAIKTRTVSLTVPKLLITKIHDGVKTVREVELPKSRFTTHYFMYSQATIVQMGWLCCQWCDKSFGKRIRTESLMVAKLLINKVDHWVNFIREMDLPKSSLRTNYSMYSRTIIMEMVCFYCYGYA